MRHVACGVSLTLGPGSTWESAEESARDIDHMDSFNVSPPSAKQVIQRKARHWYLCTRDHAWRGLKHNLDQLDQLQCHELTSPNKSWTGMIT